MVGLLGMLGAGAAMGARDASNATVKAMNEMEIRQGQNDMEMNREQLRQQYLDKKYGQQRQDNIDMAKNKAILDESNYNRNRKNKVADDELNHGRKMEIENKKESGRNARSNNTIAAMKERSSSGGSSGKAGGSSITLDDGTVFTPNDADSKNAANLVQLGLAKDMKDAYLKIHASRYTSAAASSINGIRSGTVEESQNMSNKLFGGNGQQQNSATGGDVTYNLDPKTGKLILGK